MFGDRRRVSLALAVGLALLTGLVAWRGVDPVLRTLESAGWDVLWLVPMYAVPLLLASEAWRVLFPGPERIPAGTSAYLTWIGLAVNQLLPVGQVGGEVVKVRLLLLRGRDGTTGTSTVVVDKTVQAGTLAPYALLGLALLGAARGHGGVIGGILAGSLLFGAAVYLFYRLQMGGMFRRIAGWTTRLLPSLSGLDVAADAEAVDAAIRRIYRDHARLAGSVLWRMGFRVILAAEVLVVLQLLGHPVGIREALILESLGQAARAAGFAIPAGLGAQEGGFVAGAMVLGLGPDVGLVLSLAKRVRELGVGIPALLSWQAEEGRSWLGRLG